MSGLIGARFRASWIAKGSLAVADEAVHALANFVVSVWLARTMSATEYGAYAAAFAWFLLVATVHSALLIEPMVVFGAGRHADGLHGYLTGVRKLHWLGALGGTALLAVGGVISVALSNGVSALALFGSAVACPGVLSMWLWRRVCYAQLRPQLSLLSGVVYAVLLLGGVAALRTVGGLNQGSAFGAMGFAGMAAATLTRRRLQFAQFSQAPIGMAVVARQHWAYGRWALGVSGLRWAPLNAYYVVLPATVGLASAGALRAHMNLLMPAIHGVAAIGVLLVPSLVRARASGRLQQSAVRLGGVLIGGSLLYAGLVIFIGRWAVETLYGGEVQFSPGLNVALAFIPAAGALVTVTGAVLRAYEQPRLVFLAYLPWVTLFFGAAFAVAYAEGLPFVGVSMVGVQTAVGLAMWRYARRLFISPSRASRPGSKAVAMGVE